LCFALTVLLRQALFMALVLTRFSCHSTILSKNTTRLINFLNYHFYTFTALS